MNIKSEEAHRLALEIHDLTGESLTAAVTEALRERLRTLKDGSEEEFVNRVLAIGRDCASRVQGRLTIMSPDELYDENGLPK